MNSFFVSLFLRFSYLISPVLLTKLGRLKNNLARASIRISLRTYMGMTVFTSLLVGASAFGFSALVIPLLIPFQVIHPLFLPAMVGIMGGVISFVVFFAYPMYVAYSRGRKIDANLPSIANFLSVLASSGMPPGKVISSFAAVGREFGADEETGGIVRDIELMGDDLYAALNGASIRSPSKKFATMLDGIISTAHMGGDLAGYLREQANKYKNLRVLNMKGFVDNLGVISEIYVTLLVAAPLMIIVMLSVMSFIGGGVMLGNLDPKVLLDILTFLITPMGALILILAVESITPQR